MIQKNTTAQVPLTVRDKCTKEAESFIYLGSVVDRLGGTDSDIKSRFGKVRTAFSLLKTYGHLKASAIPPSCGSFTPTLIPSVCLERKPGGLRKHPCKGSILSITPVSGASSTSDGLKESLMKTRGGKQGKNQ